MVRGGTLERRLVLGILALFLIPTLVAAGVLAVLFRRGAFADTSTLVVTVVILLAAIMGYQGLLAHAVGRALLGAVRDLRHGTELMATVHPEHRHRVETGDDLEALAGEINNLADHLRDARIGLEAEVARATSALETDRGMLSAILGELDEGVVVIAPDGRIRLANRAAEVLLGGPLLNANLLDRVDRETLERVLVRRPAGGGHAERFSLHSDRGALLQVGMTSLADAVGEVSGFVLALRDVSHPASESLARQRALDAVLRGVGSSLTGLRSLADRLSVATAGSADGSLADAVAAEVGRLAALIGTLPGSGQEAPAAPGPFQDVTIGDLVRMIVRRVEGSGAVQVGEVDQDILPLRVEVSALSAGLAHLLRVVLTRPGAGGRAWIRPEVRDGLLHLDIGAPAAGEVAELEAALDVAIGSTGVQSLTARGVVREHAGQAWAYTDPGQLGFRVALPIPSPQPAARASSERARSDHFVGMGTVSGVGSGLPTPARSLQYDFTAFEQMRRQVLPSERSRLLEALTFVALDTETTGLDPDRDDRIVSLAGVRVRGGVVRREETFDVLVNPERPVPADSTRLHGIADAMLAGAPTIDLVLPAFERFARDAVLVGHEIWFDLRFLAREAQRTGSAPLTVTHPVLDIRLLSEAVHGAAGDHALESIAARLGVTIEGRHSALGDALAAAGIFVRLIPLLRRRGVTTLGQALDAVRAGPGRRPRSPGGP